MQRGFLGNIIMVQTCMDSPARGSSSSLLVEGSGSSRIPRESAPEMATAESLVEELSEDAGGELKGREGEITLRLFFILFSHKQTIERNQTTKTQVPISNTHLMPISQIRHNDHNTTTMKLETPSFNSFFFIALYIFFPAPLPSYSLLAVQCLLVLRLLGRFS